MPVAQGFGGCLPGSRGVTGRFAVQNACRNPRRSAATATARWSSAIAVVSLITVLVASLKATVDDDVKSVFGADLVVNTEFFGGSQLSPRARRRPAACRRWSSVVVGVAQAPVQLDGDSTVITATDPDAITGRWSPRGRCTPRCRRSRHRHRGERRRRQGAWRVGTTVSATFHDGSSERVTVGAVYAEHGLARRHRVAHRAPADGTDQPTPRAVFVTLDPESPPSPRGARSTRSPRGTAARCKTVARVLERGDGRLDLLLGIVYVLLALAIVIALLGIANTLSLAVYERRREIGLLRAVGETRRQVRSVLRLESVIVSGFGTILGLALGVVLGWILFGAVADDGTFSVPIGSLAVIAVVGAFAGVLAAWRPARRALADPDPRRDRRRHDRDRAQDAGEQHAGRPRRGVSGCARPRTRLAHRGCARLRRLVRRRGGGPFCGITATVTTDPALPVALYRAMHVSLWLSIPMGVVAVGTGVALSLGTAWGLVRHWWVVAKIGIAAAVIVTDVSVISSATANAVSTGTASSPLRDGTVAHCVVLAVATGLSASKPNVAPARVLVARRDAGRPYRRESMTAPDCRRRAARLSRPSRFDLVLAGVVLAAQVGFTAVAASHQPERRGIDALAVVLLLAGPAALAVRRRFPVAVLEVTFASTLAYSSSTTGSGRSASG